MKKKSGIKYLRYRNLTQELAMYGYEYTPPKALFAYGMIVLVAAIFGLLYKLELPYISAIGIIGVVFSPMVILQTMKGRYHTTMFSLANNYMEQFLYSFKRNGTVLNALLETATIFDEGIFYEVLERAIEHIQYTTDSEDPEREALDIVGEFFHCERIDAIHSFVIGAQRRGGDAGGSIVLLAKNRAMWAERVMNLQKEFQIVKRNIMIALVATILICILPLYLLGGDLDISSIPLCQISAVVLIGICMLIYVKADKKLCRSWIEKEVNSTGMGKKYLQVRDYDEAKEAKSSQKMAIIPIILFIGAFIYFKNIAVLVTGVVVVLFFLNQHKIGHSLAMKKVAREIEKQFPNWLMEVALLLQTDNVQMAIRKSMDSAPEVLVYALEDLIDQLEEDPNAIEPYHRFLKEYRNPDVQSAMKMLYALSSGNAGDVSKQVEELIDRNNAMMDKAEKLEQEDKIAGMKVYILLPSLLASFKLMVDMALLLVVFLQNLTFGM
jgi:CRISPR/Cas system CSM-associated protein Csm2 small subunit